MLPNIDDIERYAIFLDLDGTVAELVAHPDSVQVDRSTLRLLETLSEKVGRALAVVSGREIAVVDRTAAPARLACRWRARIGASRRQRNHPFARYGRYFVDHFRP